MMLSDVGGLGTRVTRNAWLISHARAFQVDEALTLVTVYGSLGTPGQDRALRVMGIIYAFSALLIANDAISDEARDAEVRAFVQRFVDGCANNRVSGASFI